MPLAEKFEKFHHPEGSSREGPEMNPEKKRRMAHFLMPAACLVFGISTLAMLSGFEPFYSGYYSFAWWSYIIFIESFLYCRCREAKSLLFENPGKFLLLLPLSSTVWLVFEALNFRLSDWHYIDIPSDTVIRWTGYLVAYIRRFCREFFRQRRC